MKHEESVVQLTPWREIVGVLEEIVREDNQILVKLSHMLELPLHLYSELESKIGKRISILQTEKDFRFRILPEEDSTADGCHHANASFRHRGGHNRLGRGELRSALNFAKLR